MALALLFGCGLEILESFRRALCGVLDDEASSVAAEFRDWLRRRIRGPGQLVGTLPDESLAGREQLIDYLARMQGFLDDTEARYLGIYGMGGVGKTTLLEQFNNNLVRSNTGRRFDHVFFITVSRSPNIEEIKRKIEEKIGGNLSSLGESRFLLLLDDVWEKVDLRKMGIPIPSIANKCKVIMTGRSKDDCHIATVDANYGRSFEVSTLSKSQAWIFFQRKVGKNLDSEGGDIARLAKSVAKRCGGLPLALEIIGSSMIDATVSMWKQAEVSLSKFPHTKEDMENKVLKELEFSFDMLKDDNIRKCLLYCCLFKEDELISKDKLIDYWYAEGFLDYDHPASFHEALVRGDNNITALVSRSLLQNSGSYVKMHDVVLETCLWLTSGKFDRYEKFCVYHEKDPDHNLSTTTLNNLQRLSILAETTETINRDGKDLLREIKLLDLRTLLCNGTPNRIPIEKINFQNCKNLRVLQLTNCDLNFELKPLFLRQLRHLDLSYTNLGNLPQEIHSLHNLVHLILASNDCLEILPDSIGKLDNLQFLDLSFSAVKSLPSSIGNLVNLERLDLFDSRLESLPDSIGALIKLPKLNLSRTKISTLPDSIGKLTHLKALDLSLSEIKFLPISIRNLVNLERLDLSGSKLESLPDSIDALIKLPKLNLSRTKISTLPDSIEKLTHLKALDMSWSEVKALPSSIRNLVHLEKLDLSNTKLESLPDSIGALIKLQQLNLSNTKISTLPDSIGKLTHLKALHLSWSEVRSLPSSIRNLVNLERLELSDTKFESLPDSINALIKLQELNLSRINISTLPTSIGKLIHLKDLDMLWSAVKSLPSFFGNLVNLESLDLSYSELESLPDSISPLIKLQHLYLSGTKISTLPDSIEKLTQLKTLHLSWSEVKSLPSSIGNLVNLERLDLFDSKLESLPDSIGALIKLQELNISKTKISTLPDSIGKLTQLKGLHVSWSEVKSLPSSIENLINLKRIDLLYFKVESHPDSIFLL